MSAKCAICGREAVAAFKPFCSARCAQIDLGRWLGEDYRVPAAPDLTDGDEGLD